MQTLTEALQVRAGEWLIVNGAGGVTGGLVVQLAAHYGMRVIATASATSAARVRALGAAHVVDYRRPDWPSEVREVAGGAVPFAANAARGHAVELVPVIADGGRLATLTSDGPPAQRGITVSEVYVRPDRDQLGHAAQLVAAGVLSLPVAETFPLSAADRALARARGGASGAIVLLPGAE